MIIVPWQALSADALAGVIDDFVLREGTDYGARMPTLEEKRNCVLGQLRDGSAQVVFDPQTRSTTVQQCDGTVQ